ncbi:hypothetical protein SNEBB_007995 [Seison nebaliae]|nr:hypothetical protein SNEBB_007995 [Seison nebaliae]
MSIVFSSKIDDNEYDALMKDKNVVKELLEQNNSIIGNIRQLQNRCQYNEVMSQLKVVHRNLVYLTNAANLKFPEMNSMLQQPEQILKTNNETNSFLNNLNYNSNIASVSLQSPAIEETKTQPDVTNNNPSIPQPSHHHHHHHHHHQQQRQLNEQEHFQKSTVPEQRQQQNIQQTYQSPSQTNIYQQSIQQQQQQQQQPQQQIIQNQMVYNSIPQPQPQSQLSNTNIDMNPSMFLPPIQLPSVNVNPLPMTTMNNINNFNSQE